MVSLLIGMAACSDAVQEVPAPAHKGGTVMLTLRGNKMMSRATDPGVDNLNENTIKNADLFFFEAGKTNQAYVYHTANLTVTPETGVAVVNVPSGVLDLENGTAYDIYAIANASLTEQQLNSHTTLEQLKQLPATDLEELVQASFVMDGILEDVALVENENSGTIDLERAASKVSLEITVVDKVEVGEEDNRTVYTPILTMEDKTSAMTVAMYNRVKNGLVNGNAATPQYLAAETREISEGAAGHIPFYSYPNDWSRDEEKEAYLSLKIQWHNSVTGTILPYTYRIPVNEVTKNLLRNHHYKIKLNVAILGSPDEETPVVLEPEYVIENWSEEVIDTDMKKYQYLWVKDHYRVMNNEDTIKIDYASSTKEIHVVPGSLEVTRYDAKGTNKAEEPVKIKDHGVTIKDNGDGTFSIVHKIIRKSEENDLHNYYRPWTIKFKVANNDGITDEQEIVVIQYPAIYAVADFNNDGNVNRFVNGTNGPYSGTQDVYDDKREYIGSIFNLKNMGDASTSNENRNQYTIYVTVLNEGDDYYIGDPRTESSDNLSNLKLTNYHPAKYPEGRYTPTVTDKTIAPAFKIASSWAVTTSNALTYEQAQRRCAAYQENGYPAGRWRLPTEAEIKFVNDLSDRGYIPTLLDGQYWASSKRYYTGDGFGTEKTKRSARCVYDVWYWGNEKIADPNTFIWGDEIIK